MSFAIGNFEIGTGHTFVIAEIGNNHNGSFARAIEMIDQAKSMDVDCVKFQMRHIDEVYRKRSLGRDGNDLGTEYILDLLDRFELSVEEHRKLFEYCQSIGIQYMCTPWDKRSLAVLEEFGVDGYKVASADLTNLPFIDLLTKTNKPLILSTGMSQLDEVKKTVSLLNARHADFALLHCNSTYPAPFQDINLKWMSSLQTIHPVIGYSGHERGIAVSLAAVSMGAQIIERHFTLDRTMEGPDHAASLTVDEFSQLISGIREIEQALGSGEERVLSQGVMINRENLGKSLVAVSALSKGHVITPEDMVVRSPGQGLSPQYYLDLIGKTLSRDMQAEDFFYHTDLSDERVEPREYQFDRPWGVPVRYHDYSAYDARIDPDFFEFHLSYADMDLTPSDYIKGTSSRDFIVHAPELFAGSHLMDLTTADDAYLEESLRETQRVIDITRALNKYFPSTERPMIVANIGGFSMDDRLSASQVQEHYERFADSLKKLDRTDVEIIPQTMAPYPWHFGGQRYQNLFVKPEEIVKWCDELSLRMCFDISHSCLASNALAIDFYELAEMVAPYTAHLHLGDAKGLNGEGLQVGDGEIDFAKLNKILQRHCPKSPFIPEIWQGHKNDGEGFWIALERLEGVLK